MLSDRSLVPCHGCTACCHGDAIMLFREHENIEQYLYEMVDLPGAGIGPVLKKVDGHCIYLVDGKCSIWDRAPYVCRIFDCRKFYLARTRAERRRMVKDNIGSQEVMKAGRDRLDTLTPEERRDVEAYRDQPHRPERPIPRFR